ncbi:Metallo-dependent hydrolase [Ophiobolus disseminans]|uniref:Metallo-dependent hydrolase n=1 Tax=Ophiobolus disseminans TaxID=1469910 RepID=A0A6A6ZL76_9PLEO|nr:Metallo-dependent hydrolase [Ophiobolus disseminans]
MYIDDGPNQTDEQGKERGNLTGDTKVEHYRSVLQPSHENPSNEYRKIYLSLPDPTPFSAFLAQTRQYLQRYPYALVGEIGLDRSFRIPEPWVEHEDLWSKRNHNLTPGGREGRRLTPFRCSPQHQKKIFKLQLQLAAEMGRGVSVHGVQAHGLVFESLQELWRGHEKEVLSKRERKKRGQDHASVEDSVSSAPETDTQPRPYPPRICLHSYSGNASNFKQYLNPAIPAQIFASFSTAINLGDALEDETPASFEEIIKTVPDHMVLVESDLHTAGEEMDRRIEDIVKRICRVKGWGLEEGVKQLGNNWRAFAFGEG